MKFRNAGIISLSLIVSLTGASAETLVELDELEGPFFSGSSYVLTGEVFLDCSEHEDDAKVSFEILDLNVAWVTQQTDELTFDLANCQPGGQSIAQTIDREETTLGVYDIQQVSLTFTLDDLAPAFTPLSLQVGIVDSTNNGGQFDLEVEYQPSFDVLPLGVVGMSGSEALGNLQVKVAPNADSHLRFTVVDIVVDGAAAPEGAVAILADSVAVSYDAISAAEETIVAASFEFKLPEEIADGEPFLWSDAKVMVEAQMVATEDESNASDVVLTTLTFENHNLDTDPAVQDIENVATPGFQAVVLLSVLGAIAALARRKSG